MAVAFFRRKVPRKIKRSQSLSKWVKDNRALLQDVTIEKTSPGGSWRRSKEYIQWRHDVMKRDQFRCTRCGAKGNLQAHHIIPASVCLDLRYAVFNGQTLCEKCHDLVPHQFKPEFWNKMIEGKKYGKTR
jgi:hypothetical protein